MCAGVRVSFCQSQNDNHLPKGYASQFGLIRHHYFRGTYNDGIWRKML